MEAIKYNNNIIKYGKVYDAFEIVSSAYLIAIYEIDGFGADFI